MAAAMITTADIHQWLRDTAPGAQLTTDSRRVRAGDVFLAFPGEAGDGRNYIAQAIEAGARSGDFSGGSSSPAEIMVACPGIFDGLSNLICELQ